MMNKVKEMTRKGQTAIGLWISIDDPHVVEILSMTGYDFFMFDCEHSPMSIEKMQDLLISMRMSDTVPMVRVPSSERAFIQKALDAGAQGIMIPLVNSSQDAIDVVKKCRYPPAGVRGIGPWSAARHDDKYLETANDEVMVITQIETKEAVDNLDEILSVEGIDCIFIGPSDLSGSLGLIGEKDRLRHPKNIEAVDTIVKACRNAKIPVATTALYPAKKLVEQGYDMVLAAHDVQLLKSAAIELRDSLKTRK